MHYESVEACWSQPSIAVDQAVETEEAETEEKYQVFGLSTDMDGEASMEVQIVRCGEEEGGSIREMILCGRVHLLITKYILSTFWAPTYAAS